MKVERYMHNDGNERSRGDGTRDHGEPNRNSAPQRGPHYPYGHGTSLGGRSAGARNSTLVAVVISVLVTLIIAVLVAALLWWTFRDQSVETATGADHLEFTDIEVPGRDAALEAQGEAMPAASNGPAEPGVAEAGATASAQAPVPEPFPGAITSVHTAEGTEQVSSLPCDGRYVLITASIIDNTPDPAGQISAAMAMAPGDSMFLMPGACPSLRGFYQGGNVYPVLIDFGVDAAAVCEAARRGGGNARILSDRFEYLSPC